MLMPMWVISDEKQSHGLDGRRVLVCHRPGHVARYFFCICINFKLGSIRKCKKAWLAKQVAQILLNRRCLEELTSWICHASVEAHVCSEITIIMHDDKIILIISFPRKALSSSLDLRWEDGMHRKQGGMHSHTNDI
jgi:hypothetical protein